MSDKQKNRSNGAKNRIRATVAKNVRTNGEVRKEVEGRSSEIEGCEVSIE